MINSDPQLVTLMQEVKLGSEPAFLELYRLTRSGVYSKVFRILENRSDAEDVVQDVYLKVWIKSQQFDFCKGGVKGWINAIARNLSLDFLRLEKTLPQLALAMPYDWHNDQDEIICSAMQPLESVISIQRAKAVHESLQKLSQAQLSCLTLACFEDLSHSQIATHLGLPLGTVKTWVSRSYVSLRPMLKEHC
jgi:RNA polymerase sigma factor (sigma-70 family)